MDQQVSAKADLVVFIILVMIFALAILIGAIFLYVKLYLAKEDDNEK